MTDLAERLAEHRRLVALRILSDAPEERLRRDLLAVVLAAGGAANLSLLADGLSDLGWLATRDQVRTAAAWLTDQGLVGLAVQDGVDGALLRDAGADVAEGRRLVPGVAPPPSAEWLARRMNALMVRASAEEVAQALGWLQRAALVLGDEAGRCWRVTRRGADVAAGREVVAGVKRPSFDSIMRAAANAARGVLEG